MTHLLQGHNLKLGVNNNSELLKLAVSLHQDADLVAARFYYDTILKTEPFHHEALHYLAVLESQLGNKEAAYNLYTKALKLNNTNPVLYNNYGVILEQLKRHEDALKCFDAAITLNSSYTEAIYNKGNILLALSRNEEACSCFERAVVQKPDFADAHNNLGNALFNLQRFEEAERYFINATKIRPDFAEAFGNLGNTLAKLKRYDDAIHSYLEAIRIRPDYAKTFYNLGNVFLEIRRFQKSIDYFSKAIEIDSNYAAAFNNIGVAQQALGDLQSAHMSFRRAIELNEGFAGAFNNQGILLSRMQRYKEALDSFKQVKALDPEFPFITGDIVHTASRGCDWESAEFYGAHLKKPFLGERALSGPFQLLAFVDSPEVHCQETKKWVMAKIPSPSALPSFGKGVRKRKVHIAYISADFHEHATAHLISELFELHDKSCFELTAISIGPDRRDNARERIRLSFDRFIDCRELSDLEIAQLCRKLDIDIAVDLKGYTQDCRPGIFAERCAPIQINWLGYPGTMGANFMDYIIGDTTVIKSEDLNFYTEKVIWLPNSYQVNDRKRKVSDKKFLRKDVGLDEGDFVLCCFNASYKISSEVFDSWIRILNLIPKSVLWLIDDNTVATENLRRETVKRGVDPKRLVFSMRRPNAEYLATLGLADLFIDTWPYNAHTTASDALWSGLPLVTQMGRSFASRVAASLLNAIGLKELITYSTLQYESLIVSFAEEPHKLTAVREKLNSNKLSTPLFDSKRFTKDLESAYLKAFERYSLGQAPSHLLIQGVREDPIQPVRVKRSKKGGLRTEGNKRIKFLNNSRQPSTLQINEVVRVFNRGEFKNAAELSSKLVDKFPNHPFGWKALGTALRQLNEWTRSCECFEECARLAPYDPEVHNNWGITLESLGRLTDAEASYLKAIELNPRLHDAYNNLADVYIKMGRLGQAQKFSEESLRINPNFYRAHCTLAIALKLAKKYQVAEHHAKEAIRLNPKFALPYNILGGILYEKNESLLAIEAYKTAINLDPNFSGAHANLAIAYKYLGNLGGAKIHCEEALRLEPQLAEAHSNLGDIYVSMGMFDEAVRSCKEAVGIRPGLAEAHNNLGNALTGLGSFSEAEASLRYAIQLNPSLAEAYSNLGKTLFKQGKLVSAKEILQRAIQLKPNLAEAHNNLAIVLRELEEFDASLLSCTEALRLSPNSVEGMNNLGNTLRDLGRPEEAEAMHRKAISIDPTFSASFINLSNALRDQGLIEDALKSSLEAVRLSPNFAEANTNLALNYLLIGNLPDGFRLFEWRWKGARELRGEARAFTQELWINSSQEISGKSILIHAEQGLGDTIQFSRYLRKVKERGAVVIFEVQPPLLPLMRLVEGVDILLKRGDPLPDFDLHCPLMSLPLTFQTDITSIPASVPYLNLPTEAIESWRVLLRSDDFKIGICWKASKKSRSIPLACFERLSTIKGVRLISLHKPDVNENSSNLIAKFQIETFGSEFDSRGAFLDTAAVIANCDLIISTDTSIAHLAGATAKPVWVLLENIPDWRWMLNREDSPWYSSARLFRQKHKGEWAEVFDQVQQSLKGLLGN